MNKLKLAVIFLAAAASLNAQKIENAKISYKQCSNFAISKPITEMPLVETSFDIGALAKGTYLVRIGNEKFQKVVKVTLN